MTGSEPREPEPLALADEMAHAAAAFLKLDIFDFTVAYASQEEADLASATRAYFYARKLVRRIRR